MKRDKRYNIRMMGIDYMPERSQAFNYDMPVSLLDDMTKCDICCRDWRYARVGVIRAIRKQQRRHTVAYTIGIINNKGRVMFTRELYTLDRYDLIYLLHIYKAMKERTSWNNVKPMLIKLKVGGLER